MHKFPLVLCLFLLLPAAVYADRTIVSPSGYTMPSGFDSETFQTVDGKPKTMEMLDIANSDFQFETAYVARPHLDRLSESIQALVLPETMPTPSFSVGVKDILNSAGAYSGDGYYGRAYYLSFTKSLGNMLINPGSQGLIITGGLGAGAYHGFFGGVNDVLPMHLLATAEYDSRSVNYRLSLQTSAVTRFSFNRVGGSNWLSFDFHSPVSL